MCHLFWLSDIIFVMCVAVVSLKSLLSGKSIVFVCVSALRLLLFSFCIIITLAIDTGIGRALVTKCTVNFSQRRAR